MECSIIAHRMMVDDMVGMMVSRWHYQVDSMSLGDIVPPSLEVTLRVVMPNGDARMLRVNTWQDITEDLNGTMTPDDPFKELMCETTWQQRRADMLTQVPSNELTKRMLESGYY